MSLIAKPAGAMNSGAGSTRHIGQHKLLEQKLLTIADEERRRIGHELHDVVGQELLALVFMSDTLTEALRGRSSPDIQLAESMQAAIMRLLGRVRTEAWGLIPIEVEAPELIAALSRLSSQVTERFRVDCRFVCERHVWVDGNVTATNLYRIAQEAVTNAVKHGQARHISITLRRIAGHISLQIQDDGNGLKTPSAGDAGQGMQIMRYRAGLIGARLDIQPVVDGGVRVICAMQVEQR